MGILWYTMVYYGILLINIVCIYIYSIYVYMLPNHGMRPGNPIKNVAKQHQSVGSRKDQPVPGRPVGLHPSHHRSFRWFLGEPIRGANKGSSRSSKMLMS